MTIVYTSNTGSTERYAKMLAEKLSCDCVKFADSANLDKETEIIFMSWVMAGTLQDYAKVKEAFTKIKAVCAVGMFGDEKKIDEVREKNAISEELFLLPGAFNVNNLTGMYKMMMGMAMKMIKGKLKESDDPKAQEMAQKFEEGFDFVSEDNLQKVLEFLE